MQYKSLTMEQKRNSHFCNFGQSNAVEDHRCIRCPSEISQNHRRIRRPSEISQKALLFR